ncbi:B3 domain-containing transcription factor VRN1-like [Gastrolobium bilobum]|uniref:B3 domain-containing transcription factor VRN1-like n=1 Tax=Gastrolobium bilobum TaxID=150636 RepID=UPI002AB2843A|nr:B3 domain-containing transcription factor VRN1-like [Gastrolobium bilobum]
MLTESSLQKIPYNFIRKYGGDMPNPMFLKPPDGTEWEIFWTKHDGDVWLQKGWKEFARYYSLDHGHMVLFEYMQTCHFEVHIFDKSTLEIDYPLHVSQDVQDNFDQISDEDSIKILDEIPPCHKTREKSPMFSPQPRKKSRTGTSGDVKRRSPEQNLPHHVQTEGKNFEKSKFSSVKKESDGETATHCPFTNGALNEANKFASENPFFTININSGNRPPVPRAFVKEYFNNKTQIVNFKFGKKLWPVKLLCYMFSSGWFAFARESELVGGDVCVFELINREDARVPPAFLEEYFKNKTQIVMLQFENKLWPVKLLCYPHNNYGVLSSGWSQFAGESDLVGGELCVFELINREDAVLRVHIFRGYC